MQGDGEAPGMLVRRLGGQWMQPHVRAYEDEAELQQLIAESPQLVSGQVGSRVVALREVSLPEAGSLDLLLIDDRGALTLVEAKLNRNPEIRRAVVGQLLGYAGGLWRLSYERLDELVRRARGAPLADLMGEGGDFDAPLFRERIARNLRDGTFRLVFAVDQITPDLRRAVEYLNAHSVDGTEVVVLELDYSRVDELEVLVPRVFGEEAAKDKRARRERPGWTEADLFEALRAETDEEQHQAIRALYDWAQPRVIRIFWGSGKSPSVTFVFQAPEGEIMPCAIYTSGTSSSGVAVNFDYAQRRPRTALRTFLDSVDALPTVARMRDEIIAKDFAKRPTVPFSEITVERVNVLISALERLIEDPAEPDAAPSMGS